MAVYTYCSNTCQPLRTTLVEDVCMLLPRTRSCDFMRTQTQMNRGKQKGGGARNRRKSAGKCGTVEGRLSPAPASTKDNRRSAGKTRWIKRGAEVWTRRKHRLQWITETGSYRKEQDAKTTTNANQNEKKRASILPRPIDKH